ncbi:MAG: hypothetical protein WCI36_03020 [bacterium]
MRSFATVEYSTKRLTQDGNKSDYVATSVVGSGHLRQLDDRASSLNNIQYGEGFKLTIDLNQDVAVTDRVIIGADEFEVRGVKSENMGSLSFKELLLVKSKT